MAELPFSISTEAAAHIASALNDTGASLSKAEGLVPALWYTLGFQSAGERFDSPTIEIGWYRREFAEASQFARLELSCGLEIFIESHSLAYVRGQHITLETVAVGWPNPASASRQVLRAGAR